jgi:23S rRNA pseudouridine1911/1915/1917 synthase
VASTIKLSSPATKEFWEIPILHQDEHLLAIDKPAKLLVSPDRYDPERPNLMKLLHAGIAAGKPWAVEHGISYLSNAHRLDFETTGVLLLAKNKPALVQLANQFGAEKPLKTYLAIVQGQPPETTFEVDAPLAPHPARLGSMHVDFKNGKKSRTAFEVAEAFDGYTLLRCRPMTGRTHQIRIHLKWVKLPICGDEVYGGKALWLSRIKRNFRLKGDQEERPLTPRLALHAARLELPHPITGETVVIESPLPRDLGVALKYLRKYAVMGSGSAASATGFTDADEPQGS